MAAAVLATAVACGSDSIFGPPVPGDLAERRLTWALLGIDDYDLTVTYGNMWVSPMTSVVQVRNDAVVACRDADGSTLRDPADTWLCPSMDDLFDRAEDLLESGEGWTLTMEYDRRLGVIRTMFADVPRWADEEFGYTVRDLRRR